MGCLAQAEQRQARPGTVQGIVMPFFTFIHIFIYVMSQSVVIFSQLSFISILALKKINLT